VDAPAETLADQRVERMRPQLKQRRSITIPNDALVEGIAQYLLIIGPDSKIHEMDSVSPDDSVAALRDTVRAATLPLIFPDATLKKLPAMMAHDELRIIRVWSPGRMTGGSARRLARKAT
jgi:hypothetical protein